MKSKCKEREIWEGQEWDGEMFEHAYNLVTSELNKLDAGLFMGSVVI
jgi:hypothetical protein